MRLRTSVVAIIVIVIAGGGAFAVTHKASPRPQQAPAPPIPVVAGTVSTQDVPIYLRGFGTVIAYNTDIVRSRSSRQSYLLQRQQ